MAAIPGLLQLEFETTASSLLNRNGRAWERYQQSLDDFGGDEVIVAALPAERPFDPAVLDEIGRIGDAIEVLPGVRRVDSIHTMPMVRATPDTLDLDPAVDGAAPSSPAEIERVRAVLMADRIAPGTLVSHDGTTFAINVLVDRNVGEAQEAVVEAVHRALDGTLGWISGVPVFESRVGTRTLREIALFVPFTFLLIAGLLALAFRSWRAVVVPMTASAAGCWLTLGLMGALGEPITMLAALLPSVLLALGCAYVMHLLTAVRGVSEAASRAHAMERVAAPIALSGLTTAVGFLAMSIVDVDAIRALGAYGGIGAVVTVTATLTLAPALLASRGSTSFGGELDARVGRFGRSTLIPLLAAHRSAVVAGWIGLAVFTTWGLARLEIETDGAHWWPHGSPVRDSFEAIRERLSGISPMNVVIRSRDGRAVIEPEVVERIDALTAYLNSLEGVGKAVSIADPLRQIHGGFSDDSRLPLPGERRLIEQYLLLLESVEHIHDLVSRDRLAANVVIRADNNGSRDLLEVASRANAWWAESGPRDFSAHTTGIMFEFARAEDAIAWGQVRGLSIALGAIALVLLLVFRRPGLAVVALVPNLLPLLIIFGAMGLLGISLDAGTVCLGSLALGIAVDDTIHTVAGYRLGRDAGLDRQAALETAFERVLPALVYSTLAIGFGFAVLGLSEFTLTRNLGLVTVGLVSVCLAADITLLPALLLGRRATGTRTQA